MAKKEHISETPATQFLRKHGVAFSEHPYEYEEHGGTAVSSRELGVEEHAVVAIDDLDILFLTVKEGVQLGRHRGGVIGVRVQDRLGLGPDLEEAGDEGAAKEGGRQAGAF